MPYLKRMLANLQERNKGLSIELYRKQFEDDEESEKIFNRSVASSNKLIRELKRINLIRDDRSENSLETMLQIRRHMDGLINKRQSEFMKILKGDDNTAMFLNKFISPSLVTDSCLMDMYDYLGSFDNKIEEPVRYDNIIMDTFNGIPVSNHWLDRCNYYRVECSTSRGFTVIDMDFEGGVRVAGRSAKKDRESLSGWRDSNILIIKKENK